MRIKICNAKIFTEDSNYFTVKDLFLEDGIVRFNKLDSIDKVIDLQGKYLVNGIVDLHTHCFEHHTNLGVHPDDIGYHLGVSTIVDAGSAGSDNFQAFKELADSSKTNIISFINYSKHGLALDKGELSDLSFFDEEALKSVIENNKEMIKGIKLRASSSVTKDLGFTPIKMGKSFAKDNNLPVMVHIGNAPPYLEEILEILEKGDIITHCFHGKDGGILQDGSLKELVRRKQEEGVIFDIGHGSASFSFNVAKSAILQGFIPYVISTDVHSRNFKTKINSLSEIMTKLEISGMSEEDIIKSVSYNPRNILGLNVDINEGDISDLSVITKVNEKCLFKDSEGIEVESDYQYRISAMIIKEEYIEVEAGCKK